MNMITTTYKDPDLDGYGCAMAYAELLRATGKDAQAHIWGTPHIEVQWLISEFDLPLANGPTEDTDADVILLDASYSKDLPEPLRVERVTEIIDHRVASHLDAFTNSTNQIELIGAAATLVAERFKKQKIEPSKESALYLLGGILSNTQNFSGISTDRDKKMADWLWSISKAPQDLAMQMFKAKSDLSGERLRDTLFGDLKTMSIHGNTVAIGQLEIIGISKLISERKDELTSALTEIQVQEKSDYTFINMKDLDTNISTILCNDDKTAKLLSTIPDANSSDLIITSPTMTLRKQMSKWLRDRLEHN
jgi:manganese-dependent inorganic pyrophosphatase